jgi:uncharacterized protein YjbJ (UPF0337 family)
VQTHEVLTATGENCSARTPTGRDDMTDNAEDLKGRAKEAAGDLTGDESLQREGKVDQALSTIKDKVATAPTRSRTCSAATTPSSRRARHSSRVPPQRAAVRVPPAMG